MFPTFSPHNIESYKQGQGTRLLIDPLHVTLWGAHTGGQLEQFSMGKMYRGHLCHLFAKNADISFFLMVAVCLTTHSVLRDIVLLAGIQGH